jgi:protein-disulfide isomerase
MKTTVVLLLLGLSAVAQTPPAQKTAFDKATLEAYLRHLELWQPEVVVKLDDAKPDKELPGFFDVVAHLTFKGAEKQEFYIVSQDGKKIIRGEVFEINKSPFQNNIDKLSLEGQPTLGPANAPITIAMFSDFQCPICKEEAQILRANLQKTFPTQVRLYFLDFPLDTIHNWARTAAIAGRCVYKQNPAAFWDYFDWVYDSQQAIGLDNFNSKLQVFATTKKLDGMQLGRCVDSKASEPDVDRTVTEGRSLQVSATPTMFMNGRKLEGGLPWTTIETLINIELDHQSKVSASAKKADDDCCTVTIPKIVK